MHLETVISGDPAVRGLLEKFELGQIWTSGDRFGDLAEKNWDLQRKHFRTTELPLHVIVAPDGTELARFAYDSTMTPADYAAFLESGLKAFKALPQK